MRCVSNSGNSSGSSSSHHPATDFGLLVEERLLRELNTFLHVYESAALVDIVWGLGHLLQAKRLAQAGRAATAAAGTAAPTAGASQGEQMPAEAELEAASGLLSRCLIILLDHQAATLLMPPTTASDGEAGGSRTGLGQAGSALAQTCLGVVAAGHRDPLVWERLAAATAVAAKAKGLSPVNAEHVKQALAWGR